jgi:putative FmdB family regulatory protein
LNLSRASGSLWPVPLYEYSCRACSNDFEALVRAGERAICPACGSADLARLMSVASVGRRDEAPAPSTGACGTCGDPRGPGSCAN